MTTIAALWGARGLALIGALLIGLLGVKGWLLMRDHKVAEAAKAEVVQASKEAGAKANAKNDVVRRAAAKPGALERLRSDPATCRDCGRVVPRLAASDNQSKRPDGRGDGKPSGGEQSIPAKLGLHVRTE